VLIPNAIAEGIVAGRVRHLYRRWDRPRAKVGGSQLTRFGVIAIDSVEEVADASAITHQQAVEAGERDLSTLLRWLDKRPEDRLFRIGVRYGGPDPRLALRGQRPDGPELALIALALDRMDAARSTGPWTRQILTWIRDNPAVVSKVLAQLLGRELQPMKADIRKLKALGLTISLEVGYQLSPRGAAYLDWEAARSASRQT